MTLIEISRLDGIVDLAPMIVRSLFAKAWKAEQDGNNELAAELLDKAVQAEQDANS